MPQPTIAVWSCSGCRNASWHHSTQGRTLKHITFRMLLALSLVISLNVANNEEIYEINFKAWGIANGRTTEVVEALENRLKMFLVSEEVVNFRSSVGRKDFYFSAPIPLKTEFLIFFFLFFLENCIILPFFPWKTWPSTNIFIENLVTFSYKTWLFQQSLKEETSLATPHLKFTENF